MSITGTSTNTPTTVAKAAPECNPNRDMATATASSKKLEVPIRHAGAAILWSNLINLATEYAIPNMPYVWIVRGTAIKAIISGFSSMTSAWNPNNSTTVKSKPIMEKGLAALRKFCTLCSFDPFPSWNLVAIPTTSGSTT